MAQNHVDTVIFPQGGLNTDDDLLMLPSGDARYRENVIISDDGNFNVFSNVLGNTLKNTSSGGGAFTYPGGDLRVIGYVENKEEQAGIFFIYSSTGEHSIVQYYSKTDTLEYILRGGSSVIAPIGMGDVLNFDIDHFIDSGIIGNEEDKYLVWTDGINEPRMINIQMAINYTYIIGIPGSTAYSNILEEVIRFYKVPYLGEITIDYDTLSGKTNNLRGKLWQFAIRKKYYDNTFSVLSPFTEVPIPNLEELIIGLFTQNFGVNNLINIYFNYDIDDEIVSEYQLCYKVVDFGLGASSDWRLANVDMDLYLGVTPYFQFLADSLDIILSDADRIYDFIPDLANHLFIIDSSRVVFGGVTEGYDNLSKDDLDVVFLHRRRGHGNGLEDGIDQSQSITSSVANGASYDYSTVKSLDDDRYYSIKIEGFSFIEYISTYNKTSNEVAIYLTNLINALTGITCIAGANGFLLTNNTGSPVIISYLVGKVIEKYNSFKCGSRQFFGLQYLKDGKPFYVQANNNFYVDIPFQYEATSVIFTGTHTGPAASDTLYDTSKIGVDEWFVDQLGGARLENVTKAEISMVLGNGAYWVDDFGSISVWDIGDVYEISYRYHNFYNSIDWNINHLPPPLATHYQWVYLGSNISLYEYYLIDDTQSVTIEGNYTVINRNILTLFQNGFNNSLNYGFEFQKGDRIRFIGYTSLSGAITEISTNIELFDELYDYEILLVDATSIYIRNVGLLNDFLGKDPVFAEIYRPIELSSDNSYYQAISPVFEIYDNAGTNRHRGELQDQTSTLPAIGVFNSYFANCFLFYQAFVTTNNITDYSYGNYVYGAMESYSYSLLYDSKVDFFGKFNVKNDFAKRDYYNNIRWGGKFFDESGVNFMSTFKAVDLRDLDDKNGKINKIQQIGDTLKVYQERMTNSFYLKTTSSTAADGSQAYVFNEAVMSQVRQSVFDYGCTHFTSYIKTVREAFYFDIINSVVIKDTPGGPLVISDQKMHTYFKAKSKQVLEYTAGTVLILGGYEEDLDMYLLTFIDPDDSLSPINETIGYFLPTERWISFYSFIPEYYGKISGDTAIMFCDGQMYLQNSNPIRNNFCGTQFTSIVDVHSTANAPNIKVFEAIEIVSTGIWSPNLEGDIEINLPDFMQSRILEGKFKRQEGIYNSEFLKDALVKDGIGGITFEREQLHSGRALRGHEIRVRLRNSDTIEANLRLVTIKGNISR